MTTIDNYDININDLYARRQVMVEQINQQFRLQQAGEIPPQTQVMNLNPELTHLDILLGIVPLNAPWAYFFAPKTKLRRSPFAAHRVASTMGSIDDQAALFSFIQSISSETEEEEDEKQKLLQCFKQIEILNEWMGFIFGRKGQFLQG